MRAKVGALLDALGTAMPRHLTAVVDALEASSWPEVADRWSRLTPSGFPIEITVGPAADGPQWAAEIAGPEIPEHDRLGRVAAYLAANGPALDPALLEALAAAQAGRSLRFGAWLGGRETAGHPPRLKLYAEVPDGADLPALDLPDSLLEPSRVLPRGTTARMLGVEPARGRLELYLRLPAGEISDLAPFLHVTGHSGAWSALRSGLPDGLDRLAGRRLGISIACADGRLHVIALFASARTLFPSAPELLATLVPVTAEIDTRRWRAGLVTLGLDPTGRVLPAAVGVCPRLRRPTSSLDDLPRTERMTAGSGTGRRSTTTTTARRRE